LKISFVKLCANVDQINDKECIRGYAAKMVNGSRY